ncbi:CTNA2-like protein [Mya arenaria]|uniref:CTNA2-like protein n=1 Tax=Mya arenaria TaxID=6604 RepID=A0ABY7FNK8_MYAAR|nr:CTNA2-like protein [Mya arenaria]
MDVTFGLLSNLVKTRSIQRVLAPIASQISLLIILNESEDGSQLHLCKMVPCAKVVMQAAYKLVSVAKQQAKLSSDKEFDAQMVGGCEVLELASSGLYVAAERMEASSSSPEARAKLVQASKDVLQATMKVLLVADDAEIRRLVTAANIVTEKLSCLNLAENMMDLVQRFKEFTDALTVFTALTDRRQRDTISARQRERMVTSLTIMKKSVSSLSVSLQNSLGKAYVMNEMQTAVGEIVDTVQNKDMDRDDLSPHEAGAFVCSIDLALECLSEGRRAELHMDLELWTEEVVRHSMTVAHLCYNTHRDMIVATCQRVIQEKCRVVELHRAHVCDFYDVCEALTDEFCELEKNVNVALLHLVVEHFKETTEPLERLIKAALKPGKGECLDGESACLEEFEESAERICQIAILAAASSTDARRVQVIRVSVQRLESLEPDVVAGAMTLAKAPHNTGAVRHLKLLMREWSMEMTNLLQVLDEMTDPRMFMLVSERKVEEDLHTCNGCILLSDLHGVTVTWQSAIGRSRRVAQVAERVVDANLLSWSTKGDKQRVNQLCGDALGWTNHVADVAQSVLKYCMDTGKKKEMSNVCFSMDEIVSELVQSAKYVLHGDFSHLTELQTQSYTWATQLESVQGHHKALTDLVTCSEKIGHEVQGHKRLEALRKDKSDLDDLTVTFKTTAQVATEQGVEVGVSQVEQVGREWAGKMFSMTSDFELVCEALMGKGKGRKLWTNLEGPPEEVAEALEGENKKIKELMKMMMTYRPCTRVVWETCENAIQCVDLARQQCAMYAGPVDAIIEHTFTIKITHGDKRDGLMSEFEATLDRFSMSATTVHKKVLSGIQLSSELTHRSAVRQCLDGINKLAPAVVNVLRQLVDVQNLLAPESQESPSFDSISERLQQTEAENQPGPAGGRSPEENAGVRLPGGPSILAASYTGSRIHNSDESHDPRTKSHDLATKSHGATVGPHYGTKSSKNSTSISNTNSGSKNGVLDVNNSGTTILLDKCISGEDVDNLEPVIVNLEEIEEQIILNASQQLEQTALSEDGCETAEGSSQTNKHSALGAKPTQAKSQSPDRQIFELLKGARYIERETSRWADTENAIVKVASTMAQQINHMTQYVHHEGPIKTHLGLVETAKALAGNSDRVLQFANTLAKHCVDKSFSTDLVSYCVQVPLVRQQLMILANVQLGTANTNNHVCSCIHLSIVKKCHTGHVSIQMKVLSGSVKGGTRT